MAGKRHLANSAYFNLNCRFGGRLNFTDFTGKMTKVEETNRREKSGNEPALVSALNRVHGILGA